MKNTAPKQNLTNGSLPLCSISMVPLQGEEATHPHDIWMASSTWSSGMNGSHSFQSINRASMPESQTERSLDSGTEIASLPEQLLFTINALLISGYTGYSGSAEIELASIRVETAARIRTDIATEWYRSTATKLGSIHYITHIWSKGPINKISFIHTQVKRALIESFLKPDFVSLHSQLLIR